MADSPADDATACGAAFPVSTPDTVQVDVPTPVWRACTVGVTDEQGAFVGLAAAWGPGTPTSSTAYTFVPMHGGDPVASYVLTPGVLVPQPRGHHLQPGINPFVPAWVSARPMAVYDDRGNVASSGGTAGSVLRLLPVPGGGSVALTLETLPSTSAPQSFIWRLERVGNDGVTIATYDLGTETVLEGTVDLVTVNPSRHVLVATLRPGDEPGQAKLRWLDESLRPLTDWFAPGVDYPHAIALADGSVAFPPDTRHILRDGETALRCAPGWLRAMLERPATKVSLIRRGTAYALTPTWNDSNATRTCAGGPIEVLAANGARCARIQLPVASCALSIGADGTVFAVEADPGVILASTIPPDAASAHCPTSDCPYVRHVCHWRWWPRLLR